MIDCCSKGAPGAAPANYWLHDGSLNFLIFILGPLLVLVLLALLGLGKPLGGESVLRQAARAQLLLELGRGSSVVGAPGLLPLPLVSLSDCVNNFTYGHTPLIPSLGLMDDTTQSAPGGAGNGNAVVLDGATIVALGSSPGPDAAVIDITTHDIHTALTGKIPAVVLARGQLIMGPTTLAGGTLRVLVRGILVVLIVAGLVPKELKCQPLRTRGGAGGDGRETR